MRLLVLSFVVLFTIVGQAVALSTGMPQTQTVTASAEFEMLGSLDPFERETSETPVVLTGTIEPFDITLGTLVAARFTTSFSGDIAAFADVYFGSPGFYTYYLEEGPTLFGPDGSVLASRAPHVIGGHHIEVDKPGTYTIGEGNGLGFWHPEITGNLDFFLSKNTYTFTRDFVFGGSVDGVAADRLNGFMSGPSSIEYEYIPSQAVPEPSAAMLFACGLISVAIARSPPRR